MYHQVKEMTIEEQREMYSHVPLGELVDILIECNRLLKLRGPKIGNINTTKKSK